MNWNEANEWESSWWGDCLDTVGEEIKQRTYNRLMGLTPCDYDLKGKSVIDIGGGPVSLLLKYKNRGICAVVDPLKVPNWVVERYKENNIIFYNIPAEELDNLALNINFDMCLIYNVLQHTKDPKKIIQNALSLCKELHIFEWIETGVSDGHIHNLREEDLNKWLGGEGKVEQINENGCIGSCYYGVFKGKHYD